MSAWAVFALSLVGCAAVVAAVLALFCACIWLGERHVVDLDLSKPSPWGVWRDMLSWRAAELRWQADAQNALFLAGDDAGIYGAYPPAVKTKKTGP